MHLVVKGVPHETDERSEATGFVVFLSYYKFLHKLNYRFYFVYFRFFLTFSTCFISCKIVSFKVLTYLVGVITAFPTVLSIAGAFFCNFAISRYIYKLITSKTTYRFGDVLLNFELQIHRLAPSLAVSVNWIVGSQHLNVPWCFPCPLIEIFVHS